MELWQMWLAAAILLAAVEVVSLSLTFLWFAVAALAAGMLAFFAFPFWLQGGAFIVLSLLLVFYTRPLARLIFKESGDEVKTNIDKLAGRTGIVLETVDKYGGVVDLQGEIWTAKADKSIAAGKSVKVLEIQGVKLLVEEIKEEE